MRINLSANKPYNLRGNKGCFTLTSKWGNLHFTRPRWRYIDKVTFVTEKDPPFYCRLNGTIRS